MGFILDRRRYPQFVVAPLLVMVFAITLQWLLAAARNGRDVQIYDPAVVALSLAYIASINRSYYARLND